MTTTRPGFDAATAYRMMLRMRLVDAALADAWADGCVPGEYHSGIGEEGINAGVLLHLGAEDALALDHRNTQPLIGRGADPEALMLEVLGSDAGMNGGMAGHMHLIDPDLRAAADGVVGAAGPLAVGLAIAGRVLRPGSVAVAFHGEAAMNQGMLMEAYNLAVAWALPVVFICKDNRWSITTRSSEVTSTTPVERARAFGLRVATADGRDVRDVHAAAGRLIDRARAGRGPGFLYATCRRPSGHFEGDPLVRLVRDPMGQTRELLPGLRAAFDANTSKGITGRTRGLTVLAVRVARASRDLIRARRHDPLKRARAMLDRTEAGRLERLESTVIHDAGARARAAVAGRPVFGAAAVKGCS